MNKHHSTKKPSYNYVKDCFERKGYTLLSTEYINNRTKLLYICPRGHEHSITWHSFNNGCICRICYEEDCGGENHYNWKGGARSNNLPLYETYASQLEKYQSVYKIEQEGLELLGVNCTYCDQIFIPTLAHVCNKTATFTSISRGEANFYCSENCKLACPTYGQVKYPKGFKPATSREVQPELRKLVLVRDSYRCQICDADLDEAELHCHHIEAVSQNPVESADIDNCITLCKKHHKQVHTLPDCGYNELKCVQ